MPVTAYESLQLKSISVRIYATISGFDQVYSNFPVPTAWNTGTDEAPTVSIGGETYVWNQSLVLKKGWGSRSAKMNLRDGTVTTGVSSNRFRLPGTNVDDSADDWLDKLARSENRTDMERATLAADIDVGDTSVDVHDSSGWPGTGILHIGIEAMAYATTGDPGFTGVTRARFESTQRFHRGQVDNAHEIGTGTDLRDKPIAWRGRTFKAFKCLGVKTADGFVANGATIQSTSDLEWYRGVVVDKQLTDGSMFVDLKIASSDQLLSWNVGGRLPSAKAGLVHESGVELGAGIKIWVDDTSNRLVWIFHDLSIQPTIVNARLVRDDGASGVEDVPDGLYAVWEIAEFIKFTIDDNLTGSDICTSVVLGLDEHETQAYLLVLNFDLIGETNDRAFEILPSGGVPNNLWRRLGWKDNALANNLNTLSTRYQGFIVGDNPGLPIHYIAGPGAGVPSRIFYQAVESGQATFDGTPGWEDSDGDAVAGYVRVGEEVFAFTGQGTEAGYSFLSITARAQGNSRAVEHCTLFDHDLEDIEWETVTQGFVITNTTAVNAYRWMALSGSGLALHNSNFDKGWFGCGAFIPQSHFDLPAFETFSRLRDAWRYDFIAVFEPTPLRDVMAGELALEMTSIAAMNKLNEVTLLFGGYLVQPFDPVHPTLTEIANASAIVLDNSNISASKPIRDIDNDNSTITRIELDVLYDHGVGEFLETGWPVTHVSLRHTWGESQPLGVQVKGIVGRTNLEERALDFALPMFGEFGASYRVLDIPLASFQGWGFFPGQALTVSNAGLVKRDAVGRGETAVPIRVLELKHLTYGGTRGTIFTWVKGIISTLRAVSISPSFKATSLDSGTTYNVTQNVHRHADTGFDDLDDFDALDYILCYEAGDVGNGVVRQLTAVGTTSITLDSITGFTGVWYGEPVDYDNANATSLQNTYATLCEDDEVLTDVAAATSPPHRYSG